MTEKTTRFDPMEYLDSTEDHVELLNQALATNESRVIVHAMREIARARGMSELSQATGIGRSTLYKALGDDANPTLDTITKVLGALKLQLSAAVRPEHEAA